MKKWLCIAALLALAFSPALCWGAEEEAFSTDERGEAVNTYINHHIVDGQEWHPLPGVGIHLPEIITTHGVMLIIAALLMILVFCVLYQHGARVPSRLTNGLEALIIFIRDDISIQFLGEEDGKKMAPLFCSFFFFILCLNLMGLIPLFATATSNVSVTAALALITFAFMTVGAMIKNGPLRFFQAFIPHGLPWPILLVIIPLEILGLFIKTFALTIRLFANLLAGHIVIFALLGLVVSYGALVAPAAVTIALCIYLLEILVSFLQAYIFTVLSAMFIGQMYHPAH